MSQGHTSLYGKDTPAYPLTTEIGVGSASESQKVEADFCCDAFRIGDHLPYANVAAAFRDNNLPCPAIFTAPCTYLPTMSTLGQDPGLESKGTMSLVAAFIFLILYVVVWAISLLGWRTA